MASLFCSSGLDGVRGLDCNRTTLEWEGLKTMGTFNHEFFKYVDLIVTMSVDLAAGGITEGTYLSNLKLMLPKMSELLADKELGPYDIECGFPKRKDGLKLHPKTT